MAVKGLKWTIGISSFAWCGASWRRVEAEDPDSDLIKIGELWEGRSEPNRWVPITREKSAPQPVSINSFLAKCVALLVAFNNIESTSVLF